MPRLRSLLTLGALGLGLMLGGCVAYPAYPVYGGYPGYGYGYSAPYYGNGYGAPYYGNGYGAPYYGGAVIGFGGGGWRGGWRR